MRIYSNCTRKLKVPIKKAPKEKNERQRKRERKVIDEKKVRSEGVKEKVIELQR